MGIGCDATQPSAKGQNIQGWKVVKVENGRTTASVMLGSYMLTPGNSYTIWAKGSKSRASSDNEMVSSEMNFGSGSCTWQLVDTEEPCKDGDVQNAVFNIVESY